MNPALLVAAFHAIVGVVVEERNPGHLPYFKIWGPHVAAGDTRQTWLIIEGHNCTMSFAQPIAQIVGARERPLVSILQDELGGSSGLSYGRFKWALAARELMQRWPAAGQGPDAAEEAVARGLAALLAATPGVVW